MGCTISEPSIRSHWGEPTCIQIGRSLGCKESLSCHTRDLAIDYACFSFSGFYPDDPLRENQDQFCFFERFGGTSNCVLFAVFDGHGDQGLDCADFCRNNLPLHLDKALKKYPRDPTTALRKSFNKTNAELRKQELLETKSSGTTCVAVLIISSTAYIASLGRSRAIASIKDEWDTFQATLLSRDPSYCQDKSMMPEWENFGCNFSRGLGDFIDEKSDVDAKIEVVEIDPSHACICAASDAIFEYMSYQDVVNTIHSSGQPLIGCKRVIRYSVDQWMAHDAQTDDMTIIACFYRHTKNSDESSASHSIKQLDEINSPMRTSSSTL